MKRGATLLAGGLAGLALLGAAQAADAAVVYHGGPVAHAMTGVLVDWGPSVNPAFTNETTGDPGLLKYYASVSGWARVPGGVPAQYMDTSGANAANAVAYGHQYAITPSVTATTMSDAQIQAELLAQIQSGALPRPAGDGLQTVYLMLFPAGDTECNQIGCDGQTPGFCAYHSHAALPDGTSVLYAVLPDNTGTPVSQSCGTSFSSHTAYLGREWADTITDPLGNAWSDASGNEIGDLCGTRTTTFSGWTVPLVWSNLDRGCMGREWSYSVPTARFAAPSTAIQGKPLTVDASASSDPTWDTASLSYGGASYSIASGLAIYDWSWGDGSSDRTATPSASHAYATAGTYQVSLTVTDRLGFVSTATHSVAVVPPPPPPPVPPPPQVPVATTGTASHVTADGAALAGTVDADGALPVSYRFSYGTSASSLSATSATTTEAGGTTTVPVSASPSGLAPNTTYYFRLDVIFHGHTYSGAVQSFTTLIPAPAITTAAASWVTNTSATLSGTVDPAGFATTYHFEFGATPAYGQSLTPFKAAPGKPVMISASLNGLLPATTYHYRVVATSAGGTTVSPDSTFTTGAAPLPPPRFSLHVLTRRIRLRAALRGRLGAQFTCSVACTAYLDVVAAPGHGSLGLPVRIAHVQTSIAWPGLGRATLKLPGNVRRALRRRRQLQLLVTGYAVGAGTLQSVPSVAPFTLTR